MKKRSLTASFFMMDAIYGRGKHPSLWVVKHI